LGGNSQKKELYSRTLSKWKREALQKEELIEVQKIRDSFLVKASPQTSRRNIKILSNILIGDLIEALP